MEINKTETKTATITESELLSLVVERLKGRILFPKQIEEAKKYIKSIVSSTLK